MIDRTITTQQEWDDNSRLAAQVDDNGSRTTNSYDDLNRRTATTYADWTVLVICSCPHLYYYLNSHFKKLG